MAGELAAEITETTEQMLRRVEAENLRVIFGPDHTEEDPHETDLVIDHDFDFGTDSQSSGADGHAGAEIPVGLRQAD